MRCGPTEPGSCAAEGCAPPARGPAPARHSPGERRSAAEDAVPRLVNRACLRSNQTRQINNWEETEIPHHHCPDPLLLQAPRHYHSPIGSAHGSPQEDRAKGVTAALRQARGTGERRFPRRRAATGGPVRGSLSLIPAPPKHAPFHVHSPHSPSHSLHGAEAGKRRNSAPVPVCANTPATGTPSRGCNYTVHTVRLPARTKGMRAPTAHRRGVPAPVRPVPFGSYGFPGEPGVQSGGTSPGSSHGGRR